MVNTMEKNKIRQVRNVWDWGLQLFLVRQIHLKFEESERIRQEAIWKRSVSDIQRKGPKFGNMPDDFQEE